MSDALRLELKELIVKELDVRDRKPSEIDDDAPLFGAGLGLDSLDALQLAMAVEEHFGVLVPEGEAGKAVFASVSALAAHVAAARSSG